MTERMDSIDDKLDWLALRVEAAVSAAEEARDAAQALNDSSPRTAGEVVALFAAATVVAIPVVGILAWVAKFSAGLP